ncbi:ROK family protein [Flavobacterium sp. Fl-318]|uniref:ROK family protein n=1 Tax=Flavobacterium cupriresistens TaxID=2893885 RepID=A0ABU4RA61_9FLAO|nr:MULTISPECIES: ROK family protein [unclassified Flavobacterium]MDX6189471.1 ROK family protein [Flavobacterium sp. Fl-318]UFH41120.1 ROK family protein [Flavobacterium sp. F-323]
MNTPHAIGLDIGGTHITAAVIDITEMKVIDYSLQKESFDSNLPVDQVMTIWEKAISAAIENSKIESMAGLAVCMPGPFDYQEGVCWIKGQSKYEHFYGLNVRNLLLDSLSLSADFPVLFENDAVCFGKGEVFKQKENLSKKVIAITLGTGLGACFIDKGVSVTTGDLVPLDGEIYNLPYKEGIAEDYVSVRGLLSHYHALSGTTLNNGLELYNLAIKGDQLAISVFEKMGTDLAAIVIPWIQNFSADHIIIGGKIANAGALFLPSFTKSVKEAGIEVQVSVSNDNEAAALLGAVSLLCTSHSK